MAILLEYRNRKNKWQSQKIRQKYNKIQHASKHYGSADAIAKNMIFKRKYPLKQRKERKKFKIQRSRKKIYKRMAFDFDDFIFNNKSERDNSSRIQTRPTINYQYKSHGITKSIEKLYTDYYLKKLHCPFDRSYNLYPKLSTAVDEMMDKMVPKYKHLYLGIWQIYRLLVPPIFSARNKKNGSIEITDELIQKCDDLLSDNFWVKHNQIPRLNKLFNGFMSSYTNNINNFIPSEIIQLIYNYYVCTVKLILIDDTTIQRNKINFNKYVYLTLPGDYLVDQLNVALTNDFHPRHRSYIWYKNEQWLNCNVRVPIWFRCNSIAPHINQTDDYNEHHFIQIPRNFERSMKIGDIRNDHRDNVITMLFYNVTGVHAMRIQSKSNILDTTDGNLKIIKNPDFWKRRLKTNDTVSILGKEAVITKISPAETKGERWSIHFKLDKKQRESMGEYLMSYLSKIVGEEYAIVNINY